MTSSNRVRLAGVAELTYGTTPSSPRMRKQRITSIGLSRKPVYVDPEELRDDRMNADPILVGETNDGSIGIEWHFPAAGSLLDEEIKSGFGGDWVNAPARDNDGTADSAITAVAATGGVFTVTSAAAFVVSHLVRTTGFTASGNNGLFKISTGSATVPAVGNGLLTDEAAPPGTARIKVVGFEGASGDIAATATGLSSTLLDFTTLGLTVGGWVKIGGTGAAYRFATAACNGWARITAIAAAALTLDNLPLGWTTDAGAGKTLRVFFGDVIKNGVAKYGITLERGFMGQTTPTYISQVGMRVNTLEFGGQAKGKATGSVSFIGMSGAKSTTPLDATPDEPPSLEDYPVMAFSANCGRVGEGGVATGSPNFVKMVKFTINNNLRPVDAVSDGDNTAPAPVDVEDGSCDVAVELDAKFGNDAILEKVMSGTATAINTRLEKGGRAMIWEAPRLTPTEGDPSVQGRNQDVMLPVRLKGSRDSLTGAQIILTRFEYYQ